MSGVQHLAMLALCNLDFGFIGGLLHVRISQVEHRKPKSLNTTTNKSYIRPMVQPMSNGQDHRQVLTGLRGHAFNPSVWDGRVDVPYWRLYVS